MGFVAFGAMMSFRGADIKKMEGRYDGFEKGEYFFIDNNFEEKSFQECSNAVLENFDLNSEDWIEEYFIISYSEHTDANGKSIKKIEELELVYDEEEIED